MTFISGFSDGIFGGAKSIMSMYGMMQQAKITQRGIAAGDAVEAARQDDTDNTTANEKWEKDYAAGGGDPSDGATGNDAIDTTIDPKTGKEVPRKSGPADAKAAPDGKAAPDANRVEHPDSSRPKSTQGLDETLRKLRVGQRADATVTPREAAGGTALTTPAGNQQAIETGVAPASQREDREDTTTPPMSPRELAAARLTPKGNAPIAPSNLQTFDQPPQGLRVPPPQYGPASAPASGPEAAAPTQAAQAGPPPPIAAGDLSSWSARAAQKYGPKQPMSAGDIEQQANTPPAAVPPAAPGLGSRILSALNPIGSAQAATPAPAPAAAPSAPAPAPAPAAAPGAAPGAPTPAAAPGAPAPAGDANPERTPPPPAPTVASKQSVPQPSSGSLPPDVAGATVTLPVSKENQVAPGQTTPTAQSQQTPQSTIPPFNARPYMELAQRFPENKALVDRIGAEEGVTPARLALHWWMESRLKDTSGDGKAGERGVMQMMPGTQAQVDPKHTLDVSTKEGSLRLAARYIHGLDSEFRQDSPLSVGAYQGGAGSARAIMNGYGAQHPNTVKYMAESFPEQTINASNLIGNAKIDAAAAIKAGTEGGPDGFLHFISQSGDPGVGMTDKWRAAETALMTLAATKGDIEGMRHASDFVLQMSQQGSTTSLMNAYQAMQSGDGTTAAQQLARAYAFFPDGAMGRFGVDNKGQVFGQRVDENDPSQAIGGHFQITPESLLQKMQQTRDPAKFTQMIQEQQKQTQAIRFQQQHGAFYAQRTSNEADSIRLRHEDRQDTITQRDKAASEASAAKVEAAKTLADGKADAAALKAGAAPAGPDPQKVTGVDKEVTALYGKDHQNLDTAGQLLSPEKNALASQLHMDLRTNSIGHAITSPEANRLSVGLVNGTLTAAQGEDGRPAILRKGPDGKPTGAPMALISLASFHRLQEVRLPQGTSQALPIGPRPATVVSPNSSAMPSQGIPTNNAVR